MALNHRIAPGQKTSGVEGKAEVPSPIRRFRKRAAGIMCTRVKKLEGGKQKRAALEADLAIDNVPDGCWVCFNWHTYDEAGELFDLLNATT